ncbi:MAG: 4Fe-4S dicluster domain-containing protein [Rhodospirillum sp.]|nr:4Fe-4S dicluster domain-containing protein [Rhodospirillum sp.]MCF8490179.1 4Fe-4S dicluster domain-containing protein [Rhodospirillum sp.]MCF8501214.1 4Fe-4S dicluster domain-containing protein [Rhodospirillum sp.]
MDPSRRLFLKTAGAVTCGAAACVTGSAPAQAGPERHGGDAGSRFAMVIDLRRCIGCQACTVACSTENQVPLGDFRTLVNQYQVRDLDAPDAPPASFTLPRLCNHCDDPPCVAVCPVQATYQQKDGKVLIDADQCVGCAYCVQACPYDARFINPTTQTADKCTFCTHRVEAGLLPACVETCVGGARVFGDLKDPNSEINRLLTEAEGDVTVLRPEMETSPHVFYIGLDTRFQGKVEGQAALWILRDAQGHEIEGAES